MDHKKHYRHELKYVIPFADYVAMRARLRPVMKIDPHADTGGRYRIRSQIDSLVETDPSAFYSYEEYENAAFESQSDPLASFTSLTSVSQKAPSASGSSEGSSVSDGSKTKPESRPSFSGMPGSSSSQTKTKNLVSFGICLAVMIAALILAKCYKRRK